MTKTEKEVTYTRKKEVTFPIYFYAQLARKTIKTHIRSQIFVKEKLITDAESTFNLTVAASNAYNKPSIKLFWHITNSTKKINLH